MSPQISGGGTSGILMNLVIAEMRAQLLRGRRMISVCQIPNAQPARPEKHKPCGLILIAVGQVREDREIERAHIFLGARFACTLEIIARVYKSEFKITPSAAE